MKEHSLKSFDGLTNHSATTYARLADASRGLFPRDYGLAVEQLSTHPCGLGAREARAVVGAVRKRRCEFAAGRVAARRALVEIGFPPAEIPAATDRAPIWPEGAIGSISHTKDVAVAVVSLSSTCKAVGVDIEVAAAVKSELWPFVLVPHELRWIKSLPSMERPHWATVIFSAKEAFYKFQYPLTRCRLDFLDVEIVFSNADLFTASVLNPPINTLAGNYEGRVVCQGELIVTGLFQSTELLRPHG